MNFSPDCIAKQNSVNEQVIKKTCGEYLAIKGTQDILEEKKKQTKREYLDSVLEELNITTLTEDKFSRWPHVTGGIQYMGDLGSLRISVYLNKPASFYHLSEMKDK